MHYKTILCCLAFIVTLTACREEWVRTITFDKEKFNYERAEWQKKKPSRYSFVFEAFTSLPWQPVEFTVSSGSLVSARFTNENPDETDVYRWKDFGTIDDIFKRIESDYITNYKNDDIVSITITIDYHPTYHFPQKAVCLFSNKNDKKPEPPGGGLGYSLDVTHFIDLTTGK